MAEVTAKMHGNRRIVTNAEKTITKSLNRIADAVAKFETKRGVKLSSK